MLSRSTGETRGRSAVAGWLLALLSLLLTAVPRGEVRAGGFTIPLIGARMSGRLAFVGYPDDTSAIYHNPAGLTLRRGFRFDLAGTGIYSGTSFTRYGGDYKRPDPNGVARIAPSDVTRSESVTPETPVGVLPFLGVAGDFGLRDWRFGIGVFSPHNASGAFPVDGPQRFQVTKGTIFTLYIMPTVTWRPIPQLSIGAQIGPTFARIGYSRAESLVTAEGKTEVSASAWSFAWGIGLLFQPIKPLSIGVSFASQTSFAFSGTLTLRDFPRDSFPDDPAATSARRGGRADFKFPRALRFGVNYRFSERIDVGLDFGWQNYAVYDAIRVTVDEPLTVRIGGIERRIESLEEPKDAVNVFTLALGGRFSPLPQLDLRAGVMYDQSPYPDTTYTILNPDHDKAGYSVGASYRFSFGLELTLAFVHLFYFDRTIEETKVCQKLELTGAPVTCRPDTEAGGEVKDKMVLILGLQAGYTF